MKNKPSPLTEPAASDHSSFTADRSQLAAQQLDALVRAGGCDLHMHTTASDGSDSPESLFDRVCQNKLRSFAVTDHDVMQSLQPIAKLVAEACEAGLTCPIFVPGVEVSVSEDRELHLLAYFPLGDDVLLEHFLEEQRQARHHRNIDMVTKLQSLGYAITLDALIDKGQGVVGRMQAAHLLTERGYTRSIHDAFERVLGFGKPGYVERPRPSLKAAITQIRRCGGVPVLAHPAIYKWCDESAIVSPRLINHLRDARDKGLLGVEAFHGETSLIANLEVSAAACFLGLLRTCGSDDHGANKKALTLYSGETHFFQIRETLVTGALIRDEAGLYLLARRSTPGHGCGQWELPGGKVEAGEAPESCLKREIQEELGVDATIGPLVSLLTHAYDHVRIILAVFETHLSSQDFRLTAHDQLTWKTASEALEMDLLAADIALFAQLNR
ncbi:MAG: NUDIX domain-containing protein [Eubacteriales bacterium]|nr:NUDIX domain-containing protein [Eubacteriales bacterium]